MSYTPQSSPFSRSAIPGRQASPPRFSPRVSYPSRPSPPIPGRQQDMPSSPSAGVFSLQLNGDEDRLSGMIKGISEEHRAQVTSIRSQHTYALEQKDIELNQLRGRVHQVERELDQAREDSIRKDQEKSFAVHSLEEQLRSLTGENYNLQGQLQLLRQSESLSSEKAASLTGSQQVLKNMNETYQAALDQLQHERSALQAANDQMHERLNQFVSEKNKTDGINRDLSNALEESRHKLQELMAAHTNELEHTGNTIRDLKDRVQKQAQDNEALRRANASLEQEMRDFNNQRKHDEKMVEQALAQQKEEYIRLHQTAESNSLSLQSQIDGYRTQMAQAQAQLQSLSNTKQLLQQEIQSLKSQADNSRKERAAQETLLQKQISDLNQQIIATDRNHASLQQQKAEENHQSAMQQQMLQENVAQLNAELTQMRKAAFDHKLKTEAELQELRLSRDTTARELQDTQISLQRKTNEVVEFVAKIQQLQAEKDRQRDDYEKRLLNSSDVLGSTQREIEDRDIRLEQVSIACQETSDENNMLRLRIHTLQREKEEITATKHLQQEAMEMTHNEYRSQLGQQHEEVMRIQNDLAAAHSARETLDRENAGLKARIRALEQETRSRTAALELEGKRYQDETNMLKEQMLTLRRENALQLQSLQTQVRTLEAANTALTGGAGSSRLSALRSTTASPTIRY